MSWAATVLIIISIRNKNYSRGNYQSYSLSFRWREEKRQQVKGTWRMIHRFLLPSIKIDKWWFERIFLRISRNFWYQADARAALDQSQAANYGVFANFVVIGKFMRLFMINPRFWKSHLQVVLLLLPLWCGMSCRPCQPSNNPPLQETYYLHASPENLPQFDHRLSFYLNNFRILPTTSSSNW